MIPNSKYEFESELKHKQVELEMNNTEFANYIGMHRTWVVNMWNDNIQRHPLSKQTMMKLNNRLDIDYDTMLKYNMEIIEDRMANE